MENNAKKQKIIYLIIFLISIAILGSIAASKISNNSDLKNDITSAIESISYRDIDEYDYSVDYELTGLTRIGFTIQANTNIEEFNATVAIYDNDSKLIQKKEVRFEKMTSGTRYEVIFNLTLNESINAGYMNMSKVSGKVKK